MRCLNLKFLIILIGLCLTVFLAFSEAQTHSDLSYKSEITFANTQKNFQLKATSYFWVSGEKMKVETKTENYSLITVVNQEGVFYLDPAQKIAWKSLPAGVKPVPDKISGLKGQSWADFSQKGIKKIGSGNLSGKPCLIYAFNKPHEKTSGKIWLWAEKQFPLKIIIEKETEKMTIINKEISFRNITDQSIFQIPQGYQIIEAKNDSKNQTK